jgi:cob(I)alamin adenosyltransferase
VKIYTKTGDDGSTGLLGPGRVAKDAARIEAYGTVDELNAALGVARSSRPDAAADGLLGRLQNELFAVGAALADPDPSGRFHAAITAQHVARLERDIDAMEKELAPLTQFILPGGTPAAATVHLARTICRRAERRVVGLLHTPGESVAEALLIYLNRLSDLLFVLARVMNARAGIEDTPWSERSHA